MPPSPPLCCPAPVSALFSAQSRLEGETHPRRDPLRRCAGSQLRRSHALPLGSNLQASMAGRPPRVAGRVEAAGGRRGGLGAQAVGALLSGQLPGRLPPESSARGEPAGCAATARPRPGVGNNVELAARVPSVTSFAPLAFSHSRSTSLSPARPVMSGRGEGSELTRS